MKLHEVSSLLCRLQLTRKKEYIQRVLLKYLKISHKITNVITLLPCDSFTTRDRQSEHIIMSIYSYGMHLKGLPPV